MSREIPDAEIRLFTSLTTELILEVAEHPSEIYAILDLLGHCQTVGFIHHDELDHLTLIGNARLRNLREKS